MSDRRAGSAERGSGLRHSQYMSKDQTKSPADRDGTDAAAITLHASCVSLDGTGILLMGPSGSGKSDLALRLIDKGARLVADDLTTLVIKSGRLIAGAPERLAGRLEVRGIGIVTVPAVAHAPLELVVRLMPDAEIERLPEAEHEEFLGLSVRAVQIDPFTASAVAKVQVALSGRPIETA